ISSNIPVRVQNAIVQPVSGNAPPVSGAVPPPVLVGGPFERKPVNEKPDEVIKRSIPIADFQKETDDLAQLNTTFRLVPFFRDGRHLGYKFLSIQSGSLLDRIGFQKDDVLLATNGYAHPLNINGIDIFGGSEKQVKAFDFLINRGGKLVMI